MLPNDTGMFPQLRAFNGSHNALTGPLPAALGQTGIFRLSPLQFVNGEILMHVMDLSYNKLNGSLPSFLDAASVPAQHVQKGIFLQARAPGPSPILLGRGRVFSTPDVRVVTSPHHACLCFPLQAHLLQQLALTRPLSGLPT